MSSDTLHGVIAAIATPVIATSASAINAEALEATAPTGVRAL